MARKIRRYRTAKYNLSAAEVWAHYQGQGLINPHSMTRPRLSWRAGVT